MFPGNVITEQVFFPFLSFSGADSNFTCQTLLLLQLLFEFLQFGHWMMWRNGHPRNLGQTTGWSPGNWRVPTVEKELSVINDPSSWRRDRTYVIATNRMARKHLHSRLQTTTCEGEKTRIQVKCFSTQKQSLKCGFEVKHMDFLGLYQTNSNSNWFNKIKERQQLTRCAT